MHSKAQRIHPHTERIYISVNTSFDQTGYMQPQSITWQNGHTYKIDKISDFRPAKTVGLDLPGDCYTVEICGQKKHLFFERLTLSHANVGRWFVEVTENKENS